MSTQRLSTYGYIIIGLLLVGVFQKCLYKDDFSAPVAVTTPAQPPQTVMDLGAEGRLSSGVEKVAVATDLKAFDEWNKSLISKDQHGMLAMLVSDRVLSVPADTRVKVIERKWSKTRVRILEGDFAGRAGWVPYEWVK